jgi:hypothetical protein
MWQQDDAGSLRLVWNLILREPTGRHWWDLNVDAQTGELSSRVDWGRRARYRAFALQVSSPDEGARSLHVDPADAMASPWGWHDIDGAVGGDSTDTRGNNVFAQEDVAATTDGNGFRPSGGGSLNFDFPLDLNQDPSASQSAAITNAFYLTNTLHDIYYRYGFDEAAGNFQVNNYGNGGALACPEDADSTQGNDPALVDVQDGRERNNAVFFTPPDGSPPLMELYVYTNAVAELEVTAPAPIAGAYVAGDAAFGPLLTDAGISATVVQALDAANADGPTTTDGCSPFSNAADVAGKIALIDRGVCLFVEKVENAESAGAVAAIIVNHLGDGVLGMGAGPPGGPRPTLPSLLIGQSDGDAIKAQLGSGVSAHLRRDPGGLRDSALSNDLVTHEYTHGLTTRLTGGKCNSSCLTSAQGDGMSEGWSDWYELTLGAAASDARDGSYPVATYLNFEPPTGAGIRSLPYSTDLAVNALSYADIATQSQPHGVGEVWASALWDLYSNLVDAHGFDSDLYAGSGGNNLALQIVTDALKLQPCEPSFLDARDAILLADQRWDRRTSARSGTPSPSEAWAKRPPMAVAPARSQSARTSAYPSSARSRTSHCSRLQQASRWRGSAALAPDGGASFRNDMLDTLLC